jgi:hypothetical protein
MNKKIGLLIAVACLALPAIARADNTACAGAVYVIPDGAVHTGTFTALGQQRWFTFEAKADRSYVINVENMLPTDIQTLVAFGGLASDCAGTTLLGTGAIMTKRWQAEPVNGTPTTGGDRWGMITAVDTTINIPVLAGVVGGSFQFRVEETTQINTFFSTFSGFNTFYRLSNTTGATINIKIRMVNDAGTLVKVTVFGLVGNRSAQTLNTTATGVLAIPANTAGFATFTHDGPVGALALDGFLMQGTVVLPIKILDARQKR